MLQPRLTGCGGEMGYTNRMLPKWSLIVCAAVFLSTTLVTCQDINKDELIESSRIKREGVPENRAFNTNAIIFDNTPWRPGRNGGTIERAISDEDERKIKNVATRIMSNGVEVLVKDKNATRKQEQTKYMEVKTIQPSSPTNMYMSNYHKADKRIDNEEDSTSFDIIQPSEVSHISCSTSCSCSHSKTEDLKTNYGSSDVTKTSKYDNTVLDLRPTSKETLEKKTRYGPYEFDGSTQQAPSDKIVEKYTEVINEYTDEKDSNSVEDTELLTNEQAPTPAKTKEENKIPQKNKPEKTQVSNKTKFVVADLLKLGTLGIKSLTQLAPVIEKMTDSFIKRQDAAAKTTTTTVKPVEKLIAYNVNKRIDSDLDSKHSNFPIYIPVDELETSESQIIFSNATLHQSLAWAAEHKQSKGHIVPPRVVHESPLVNGGIPISPGEIITTNSDVIVGKPAVGGPLTLSASGIKLQNPVNPPIDSLLSANEQFLINEKPLNDHFYEDTKVDDSFDLRPPDLPRIKNKPKLTNIGQRPLNPSSNYQNEIPYRIPSTMQAPNDHWTKSESLKTSNNVLNNYGRPVLLDYIPSLSKPIENSNTPLKHHVELKPSKEPNFDIEVADNSPSSSEIVNTQIKTDDQYTITESSESNKPFLVDIQPSRVANVLIPHGSSTAIVFAGSSEPHKTGDYVDDPLPYPEPGYFGSFSIDAPQMTNVHNVAPNNKNVFNSPNINMPMEKYRPNVPSYTKENPLRNDLNLKWKDKIPTHTSNRETHVQVSPQITAYNPNVFSSTSNDYDKYNKGKDKIKDGKEVIDREYENYLAVPPPPPKVVLNPGTSYDQNKPYSQRPIVHKKPVQDMKVFLNIQHPAPKEKPLQKVTSEIYFAAQAPNNKATPTYTFHIPPTSFVNTHNKYPNNNIQSSHTTTNNIGHTHGHYPIISSTNIVNNSGLIHENNDNTKTYVTLNTATNVVSNIVEGGQIIGSNIKIPIKSLPNMGLNADIPIGTNVAMKVDDNLEPFDTYDLQGSKKPIIYDDHGRVPIEGTIGDNRWNKSTADRVESTIVGHNYYNEYVEKPKLNNPGIPFINSHANFPMTNEDVTLKDSITEYTDHTKLSEQKRPAKLIPNIPTNSHGWYSSVLQESNVNNIKHVEGTTRKNIPLIHEFNQNDTLLHFGQKIESVGKPPSDFWPKHPQGVTSLNIGKPFSKPVSTEKPTFNIRPFTIKPYSPNYIPSKHGVMTQPVYNIPIRNTNYEITTLKPKKPSTQRPKPVYENSEEIYDGEEESDIMYDNDGEVSLESMKVPVVTSSNEINGYTSSDLILLQDEVINSGKNNKNVSDTQTEKPFGIYNKTVYYPFTTNKPIFRNNSYNMKPRPFTVNAASVLDHQLQQPHWQINQMMENVTNASYEDNIELNIGEEFNKPIITSSSINPSHHKVQAIKSNVPPETIFTRLNSTHVINDTNIITSTVHIKDKKPLIVEKVSEKPKLSTLATTTDVEINETSSEIIDLSPPPPTIDNNFKLSSNSETIMGMSPPPPRISSNRPPTRTSHTPRPIPIRSPPPYKPKPQKTLPPRYQTQKPIRKQTVKDEVSTYRPLNNNEVFTYKPLKKDEISTFNPNTRDNISTYRPVYNILNNIRRPAFNRDQPSSQLLPPPRDLPSKVISFNEVPSPTIKPPSIPRIVFPTSISSGWLTSTDADYYSSFNFAPTSIRFPGSHSLESSMIAGISDVSSENSYSYEVEYSSELSSEISSEKPLTDNSKEVHKKEFMRNITLSNIENNYSDSDAHESSENININKIIVSTLENKNRTRKPYPVRSNDMKPNTSKFKMPPKATAVITPTRILSGPQILGPTRHVSIKKNTRPINTRIPDIIEGTIIESSEIYPDENFIKPTQVLKDNIEPNTQIILSIGTENPSSHIIVTPTIKEVLPIISTTHRTGNEVKVSDEILPTKTEFRTTVITHTKTLSEPPKTVSSIGFVNLTHTLTVTHTHTSLVSQSEGAITETLIVTNTQTSTIVDVVTEIHTQVQPTTIIETVTKNIPLSQVEPTSVSKMPPKTKLPLDDITMSSEESDNFIIENKGTENVQKIENESENDNESFFVVLNKSQNGGHSATVNTEVETGDYDGVTRNEQVNSNGVSQVLFGEILLAGAPYLETTNIGTANILNISAVTYGKECQPDCKASRNERCQRIDSIMKCVCRPGFARMFPDRPCKPTYTYSVKLALGSQGNESLQFHKNLLDNSSKEYQTLVGATHEGINRMVMQSDLRDVYHGVHINGFYPVEMKTPSGESYQGVINDFYVQLSDNAHESRLKEVIEKYLRNNNYSLGGTDVHAAGEFLEQLDVSDFDECTSAHFHDCSEHAQCFNLRGTYTCSCLEGFADLSVNTLYPGRICSAEPVGCEKCNYHGACYSRDDRRMLCECFQWYAGSTCQINLKVVLISLVVLGALLTLVLTACAVLACRRTRPPQRSIVACIQSMPTLHPGAMPSKQRADRRALISERGDTGDASSIQNASLPYIPTKRPSSSSKKIIMSDPPAHDPPPPPAPAVMIPRARLHPHHGDSRENLSRKRSLELSSEAKLLSYLESGATVSNNEMRRKHSLESSYSANKERYNKQGALVSAGFKVSTTVRADESAVKDDRDDLSSVNKTDLEADLARFDSLRKSYSHEDLSEWTDAERRLGELTLSEARSVGGTLPASTGRAASSTRLTHQEANTMAERDLGSTFLLPHVHLYKPDLTSDVSEFDSL